MSKKGMGPIPARCKHFAECNGCLYQDVPYGGQLRLKATQVCKLFREAGLPEDRFLGIEPSPLQFGYRNKMEFAFGDEEKGGALALGLRRKGRYYEVTTVNECQIVHPDFNRILETVLRYFQVLGVPFYHRKAHRGVLRHLAIRRGHRTGEILVNLVTSSQVKLDLVGLLEELKTQELQGSLCGFLHTINDSPADVVKSDSCTVVFGQDFLSEELLGLSFRIPAFSFFQTNSLAAEKLYTLVQEFAGTARVVFDLYCGTGTIAQVLASGSEKVIGVDIVKEAVETARDNARLNGLNNCTFVAGDVLQELDKLEPAPDLVVMDPPRSGVHPVALQKVVETGAPHLIYVSCKPTSLVRDLKVLVSRGYKVAKVKCVDMFPHTPHVECVVLMSRVKK